jgi:hypothetical protein
MKDVSDLIQYWITCSNDIWTRWFANRQHGLHEFTSVEERLLEVLVIDHLTKEHLISSPQALMRRIRVRYTNGVDDIRQVCKRQPTGNVFGKAQLVNISPGRTLRVKGIDTTGTMLGSGPYVEVEWQDHFLLEPVHNVLFLLADAAEPE